MAARALRRLLLACWPGRPRTTLLDTFTRADNASVLGGPEIGNAPAVAAGTWGTTSNQGTCVSDTNGQAVTWDAVVGNAELRVTVSGDVDNVGSNQRYLHVAFRHMDTSNQLRVLLVAGVVMLYKVIAGSFTQLASVSQTTTDGVAYRIRVRYGGPMVKVWVDGVLRISYVLTDAELTAFPPSLTKVGLFLSKQGTPSVAATFDDLSVVAL